MANNIPGFLKRKDLSLLYNGEEGSELVYYVPEAYFTSKLALVRGEYVNVLGIFDYSIFSKSGKNNGLHNFIFQAMFTCKPGKITKEKQIKLTSETPVSDYRLLHFYPNDEAVSCVRVPQMVENVESFFQASFITAKIPNTIPYNKVHSYPDDAMEISGNSFGLNMQLFGMIYGEILKDEDMITPYRLTKKLDKSQTGYEYTTVKQNPKHLGSYISLTSENFDNAVIGAILSADNPASSPLEKVLIR